MEPAILVWANRNNRPHNLQKQQWDNAKPTGLAKGKGKTIENKGRMGMGWFGIGWVYLGGVETATLVLKIEAETRYPNARGSPRQKAFTVDSNRVSQRHLKYSTSS